MCCDHATTLMKCMNASYIVSRSRRVSYTGPFTEISVIVTINKSAFLWMPNKTGDLKSSLMLLSTSSKQQKNPALSPYSAGYLKLSSHNDHLCSQHARVKTTKTN